MKKFTDKTTEDQKIENSLFSKIIFEYLSHGLFNDKLYFHSLN